MSQTVAFSLPHGDDSRQLSSTVAISLPSEMIPKANVIFNGRCQPPHGDDSRLFRSCRSQSASTTETTPVEYHPSRSPRPPFLQSASSAKKFSRKSSHPRSQSASPAEVTPVCLRQSVFLELTPEPSSASRDPTFVVSKNLRLKKCTALLGLCRCLTCRFMFFKFSRWAKG